MVMVKLMCGRRRVYASIQAREAPVSKLVEQHTSRCRRNDAPNCWSEPEFLTEYPERRQAAYNDSDGLFEPETTSKRQCRIGRGVQQVLRPCDAGRDPREG
jgi:hypothetical protein